MAITQVLQGCGAWNIQWKNRLPASLRGGIGDGAHLVVFESYPQATEDYLEDARPYALYEGVMTEISSSGCSGYEMSWSLGQPSGPGPYSNSTGASQFNDAMEDRYDGVNGLDYDVTSVTYNGLYSGIWGPAGGGGVSAYPGLTVRTSVDYQCSNATEYRRRFGSGEFVSWKMYPGFRMRADYSTALFNNDAVVFSDLDTEGYGADGLLNVPSSLNVTRGIENVISDVVVYGDRNATTGVVPTETATNLVPFNSHDGTTFESNVHVDGGGAQYELEATAIRKANEGSLPRGTVDIRPKRATWLKEVDPGDRVYIWSPLEPDLLDASNQINHFGFISPVQAYIQTITRNITPGMSVWLRNPTSGGVTKWTEVTEYVQTSATPATLKVSDYLINPQADGVTKNGQIRLGDDLDITRRLRRSNN
jgi:hypothetical protein